MNRRKRIAAVLVGLALAATHAQESGDRNLNVYYRYPLAISADFHSWSSLGDFGGEFNIIELGGTVRAPVPRAPLFQPILRGSFVRFDSQDAANPEKWDHTHLFVGAGLGIVNRLAKSFEIGAESIVGYSRTSFPNLTDEPVGYNNVIGSIAPRITLVPSFNFAVNVLPTLRYSYGLGDVDRFDGLSFSVGVGVEFRLGDDPDSPQAEIRSLRISEPQVDTVFAAMQSYYVDNPVGTVTIENTENHALEDVRVSFFQNMFMDSPTPSARIDVLEPGESRTIELRASYNGQVFSTEGVTPLTGEVVVSYLSRGRPAEQRESVTYDLHDKTALTWTDDRKMGSFITSSDSAIRNYASFIRQSGRESVIDSASESLQIAMLAYHALVELGVIYQVDPTSPFTSVQNNVQVVDSISLPRDTLVRLTGDCDDLTALYATMLESVGIETAFITTPGHIYVAFDTGVPARDYRIVHPDRDMLLIVDDRVWVPVEITMLGNGDFLDAWRFGIEEWQKGEVQPDSRGFYRTRESQQVFRPVGLRETDLGLQYGSAARIREGFERDFSRLADTIIEDARELAQSRNSKRAYNQLGIYAARLGRYGEARDAFERAARMDAAYLDPRINLGAILFLEEQYELAVRTFRDAARAINLSDEPSRDLESTVYINLSKAHFELGEYDDAQSYYQRAAQLDPQGVDEFGYLAQSGDSSSAGRASEAASGPSILFSDDTSEE